MITLKSSFAWRAFASSSFFLFWLCSIFIRISNEREKNKIPDNHIRKLLPISICEINVAGPLFVRNESIKWMNERMGERERKERMSGMKEEREREWMKKGTNNWIRINPMKRARYALLPICRWTWTFNALESFVIDLHSTKSPFSKHRTN